jgi:hypothetical protein
MAEARLTASRGGNRAAATRLINRINTIVADVAITRAQKIHELQEKIESLEEKIATRANIDNAIQDELDPEDVQAEIEAADTNNQTYRDARAGFTFQLKTLQDEEAAANAILALATAPVVPAAAAATPGPSASMLPKLDLPSFKGDILQWSSFWDVFESEVDSKSYGGATKFNFLISKLEGEAKASLLGLTSSNDNYTKAKDILRLRYNQPRKVITAHYKALMNLPVANATRSSLRAFADQLESHIRGLEALGTAPAFYGDLLVCFLIDKLAIDVRRNLTRHQGNADWTLDELRNAIAREIEIMGDTFELPPPRPASKQVLFNSSYPSQATKKRICPFCSGEHSPTRCSEFKTPEDRAKIVKIKKLCSNCLHSGHTNLKDCPNRFRCQHCNQQHHTSLHFEKRPPGTPPKSSSSHTGCLQTKAVSKVVAAMVTESLPFVFLKTAVAPVCSHLTSTFANLLIDDGSQITFITARLVKLLRLYPIRRVSLLLSGFKGISASSMEPSYYDVVHFWLQGLNGERLLIQAVVLDSIVEPLEDPHREILSTLPHLQNLQLAHPTSTDDHFSVDILIGADSYWSIVGDENIHGNGSTAVNSFIGYLVSGPLQDYHPSTQRSWLRHQMSGN